MGLISKGSLSSTVLHIYDFIFIWLSDVDHNFILLVHVSMIFLCNLMTVFLLILKDGTYM